MVKKTDITGRSKEIKVLEGFLASDRSEFMAVYGRRRIGKTHLIDTYFSQSACEYFSATGINGGSFAVQRRSFCDEISERFFDGAPIECPSSWFGVFKLLDQQIKKSKKKCVIFLDELPWMVTPKSELLETLEYFWNQRWQRSGKVKLIVCGSLVSWLIKHIVKNTKGLYQRVTYRLPMKPFNLAQTKLFLEKEVRVNLTHQQILDIYMVMGGIPLYLNQIKKGKSAHQLIDQICFNEQGLLFDEIHQLFGSLFKNSKIYFNITKEIAKHRYGVALKDLPALVNVPQGGRLTRRLQALEDAGFIKSFIPYSRREKGIYYRVVDEYAAFYFAWIGKHLRAIKNRSMQKGYWLAKSKENAYKVWRGYTFETVCYQHSEEIARALELEADAIMYTWRYVPKSGSDEAGAQIDVLLDRSDGAITLGEIKCTSEPYVFDKKTAVALQNKTTVFKAQTKTDKQLFWVLISASGVQESKYTREWLSGVVTLDDLFQAEK